VHRDDQPVPGLAALPFDLPPLVQLCRRWSSAGGDPWPRLRWCARAAIDANVPNSSMTRSRCGNAPGQLVCAPTAMLTPSKDKKNSSSAHIMDSMSVCTLTLLDQLPLVGDVLPGLPPRLKARLFHAFDIAVLWNKPSSHATVRAEITETTLQAVPGILDPSQDGYDDTGTSQPAPWGIWTTPLEPPGCRIRDVEYGSACGARG
jgi:hypothetical protein